MSRYGDSIQTPAWHARAKKLHEAGMTYKEIGRVFGKADNTVRYAVLRISKPRCERLKAWDREYNKTRPKRDRKRDEARAEARSRWREQGKTKSLDSYYRQLECL